MQFVDQLLQLLRQGLAAIFRFIDTVWTWVADQVNAVPWLQFGELLLWQQVLLVITGIAVVYLVYRSIKELLDAAKKLFDAFVTLLSVLVSTLIPAILAGLIAAGGAWIVNNVAL
ncbi:MAG: hypothetical protein KTR19_07930 [Hyphomicrobiales bacterium]|nr:hypothetical protein [Hyphomicrobiales bacterium]